MLRRAGTRALLARLERFLQLCAENNMQVCVPSTPAQMFHMLRRQMLRSFRKPLIVMTPKSLLRHKLSVSAFDELTRGSFQCVVNEIDELSPKDVTRVVFCSGKVYFDLLEHAAPTRRATSPSCASSSSIPSRPRITRGTRALPECTRDRVVPGRAAEPGCLVPDPPPAAGLAARQPELLYSGRRPAPRRYRIPQCTRRSSTASLSRRSPPRHGNSPRASPRICAPGPATGRSHDHDRSPRPQLPESVADATLVACASSPAMPVNRDENSSTSRPTRSCSHAPGQRAAVRGALAPGERGVVLPEPGQLDRVVAGHRLARRIEDAVVPGQAVHARTFHARAGSR